MGDDFVPNPSCWIGVALTDDAVSSTQKWVIMVLMGQQSFHAHVFVGGEHLDGLQFLQKVLIEWWRY